MKVYKYKINLHKTYFDIGWGLTAYAKYFIVIFGAYSFVEQIPMAFTLYLMVGYMITCYFLGWAWVRFGWYLAQIEVSNQFNLFVKETRKFINK